MLPSSRCTLTPQVIPGSLCPTGLLVHHGQEEASQEAQQSVQDDPTGESQKSTLPESWARMSHIVCSSKGRAPALSGSWWGIQSLLCLHPIGVCECRDSHSTGVLLNGDEDLGGKGWHGQWAPRGWSRYGGLFRGLRQLLKRGLSVGGGGSCRTCGKRSQAGETLVT